MGRHCRGLRARRADGETRAKSERVSCSAMRVGHILESVDRTSLKRVFVVRVSYIIPGLACVCSSWK
jgi:hypothetical protein